jgi:hypothetical protein
MHTHSPNRPKKLEQILSARKLMETVFWDRKAMMTMDFKQQEATVTSEVFCVIQKEDCLGPFRTKGVEFVVLLHDNVHSHTATHSRALLEHFSWVLFDHPPYSPISRRATTASLLLPI